MVALCRKQRAPRGGLRPEGGHWGAGAGLQSTSFDLGSGYVGADLCSGSFLAVTLPEDICGCQDWDAPSIERVGPGMLFDIPQCPGSDLALISVSSAEGRP